LQPFNCLGVSPRRTDWLLLAAFLQFLQHLRFLAGNGSTLMASVRNGRSQEGRRESPRGVLVIAR
jgi:hypothetical protein